ncbi:MAG: ATP-binding protein [Acidobacteriota bacterium]
MKKDICDICGGTGFEIKQEGAKTIAVRCSCYREERMKNLSRMARIPKRYQHCDLDNFEEIHPSHRKVKKIAQKFVREYPLNEAGLLLLGHCGVGKTHIAVGILKALILEKGVYGIFYDFRDLLKEIQNSYNPLSGTTEMDILAPVISADVLVLDDLGVGKMTDWVRETLEHIINTRYNEKKTVIITSNLPDVPIDADGESLERRIGARLRSRLYEMCVSIEIKGDDYRSNIRQARFRFGDE